MASLLDNMGYDITGNDINSDECNIIGMYLRDAGGPISTLSDSNRAMRKDLTLRLHGDIELGSIKKCNEDCISIINKLTVHNKNVGDIYILGCKLRSFDGNIGRTTKGIPVFNISFLLHY